MESVSKFTTYFLFLLATVTLCSCGNKQSGVQARARENQKGTNYFQSQWQEESQFIVESVLYDIAEMACYAKTQKLPRPSDLLLEAQEKPGSSIDQPVYEVTIALGKGKAPIKLDVPVDRPIWSAEVYREATKAIFAAFGLEPTDTVVVAETPNKLAGELTDLSVRTLH